MIEKTNIKIKNKNIKKIIYTLFLDNGYWYKEEFDFSENQIYYETSMQYWNKREYDTRDNIIYFENSSGDWCKREYDDENNVIYYENKFGIKKDDR